MQQIAMSAPTAKDAATQTQDAGIDDEHELAARLEREFAALLAADPTLSGATAEEQKAHAAGQSAESGVGSTAGAAGAAKDPQGQADQACQAQAAGGAAGESKCCCPNPGEEHVEQLDAQASLEEVERIDEVMCAREWDAHTEAYQTAYAAQEEAFAEVLSDERVDQKMTDWAREHHGSLCCPRRHRNPRMVLY
jgi:hypothetical protein